MQPLEGQLRAGAMPPMPPRAQARTSAPLVSTGVLRRFDQGQYRLLLGGMLGRGHGIEALCFFLTLTRAALFDLVVQLDLPTPNDRPLRRSGGLRAWSQRDFEILLDGWFDNWSAAFIAERLGRTRGSVWYQARRLGLPKRQRRLLHWPEYTAAETLVEPAAGSTRARLPERWLVKGTDKVLWLTSKRKGLEVNWAANIEALVEIGWRVFAGQRISRIAEDFGVSYGTITSQVWWLHAQSPKSHKDLVDHFDRARGEAHAKALGSYLKKCDSNSIFPHFRNKGEWRSRRDKRNNKRMGMEF